MKKFSFAHNIGSYIFRSIMLILLIGVILHSYPLLILITTSIGIVICYLLILKSIEITFFDDFFVVSSLFNKNAKKIRYSYNEIVYVKFVFASIRGGHVLIFSYNESATKKPIIVRFEYSGFIPKKELIFLKSKSVNVIISPKNKLEL